MGTETKGAAQFLGDLRSSVVFREKVYAKFKKLAPRDWAGFANLGVEEGYTFTGDELKALMPEGFYYGRRANWRDPEPEVPTGRLADAFGDRGSLGDPPPTYEPPEGFASDDFSDL